MPALHKLRDSQNPKYPRLEDGCKAWKCLTKAEQFGIIFSAVVTSIVLILAYMYYLGRITDSHQERASASRIRRRRRRERRQREQFPATIALSQVPVVQPWAPLPPGAVRHQSIYHIPGASIPHPFPPLIPAYYPQQTAPQRQHPLQPGPGTYPTQRTHPVSTQDHRGHRSRGRRQQGSGGSSTRSSSQSSEGLPPRQPTWRQRLSRVFGIPVGRASTIASSSARSRSRSGSHPRSRSRDTPQESGPKASPRWQDSVRSPQASRRGSTVRYRHLGEDDVSSEEPESHNMSGFGTDRAVSPQTDAATVHSDDFELPPASTQFVVDHRRGGGAAGGEPPVPNDPARAVQNPANIDNDFASLGYSADQHSLPSVSSLHSDFSPDLRPSMPVVSKPAGSVGI